MASLQELKAGLRSAHNAGDTAKAQEYADAIRNLQEVPAEEAPADTSNMSFLQQLEDIGIGTAGGFLRGTASIPGLPGDLQQYLKSHPETDLGQLAASLPDYPLSGQESIEGFENLTGKIPEAKSTLGQYAESMGEAFSPGLTKKAKLVSDIATAVAGGGGQKALSDLGESLGLSPEWMGILGNIVGVTAANKVRAPSAIKIAADNAPSPRQLDVATNKAYDEVKSYTGLDKPQYANTVADIDAAIAQDSISKREAPELFRSVDENVARPQLDFMDVEATRRKANRMAVKPADSEAERAAIIVRQNLDKYFDTVNAADPTFTPKVRDARDKGRSRILSKDVAEARGRGRYGVTGDALTSANRVRGYLTQQDPSLTKLEQQAGVRAVGREGVKTPARGVGRILSSAPLQALGLLGGASLQSFYPIAAAIASTVAGKSLESLADVVSRKKLDQLEAVFRTGRDGQQKAIAEFTKIAAGRSSAAKGGILGVYKSEEANRYQRNRNRGEE